MPYNEASKAATMRYAAAKIKRVPLDMQKTEYEALQAHVKTRGDTINGYIKRAIREAMERDRQA